MYMETFWPGFRRLLTMSLSIPPGVVMRCYMNKIGKTLCRPCFYCERLSFRISSSASWRVPKRLPRWRLNSENWLSWGCHGWSLTAVRPDSFWTILCTEWKSPSPWAAPPCCPGAPPLVSCSFSTAVVWWCESHSRDSLAVQVLSFCSDGKTLWKLCERFLETRFNFSRFVGTEVVHYVFKY